MDSVEARINRAMGIDRYSDGGHWITKNHTHLFVDGTGHVEKPKADKVPEAPSWFKGKRHNADEGSTSSKPLAFHIDRESFKARVAEKLREPDQSLKGSGQTVQGADGKLVWYPTEKELTSINAYHEMQKSLSAKQPHPVSQHESVPQSSAPRNPMSHEVADTKRELNLAKADKLPPEQIQKIKAKLTQKIHEALGITQTTGKQIMDFQERLKRGVAAYARRKPIAGQKSLLFDEDVVETIKEVKTVETVKEKKEPESHWITIHPHGPGMESKGVHIQVTDSGDIVAGPAALAEKGITNLSDFKKVKETVTGKDSEKPKKHLSYKEFLAAGNKDSDWEEYAKNANSESKSVREKEFVETWVNGGDVAGVNIANHLQARGIDLPDSLRNAIQDRGTTISRTAVSGHGIRKPLARKIHKFVSESMMKLHPEFYEPSATESVEQIGDRTEKEPNHELLEGSSQQDQGNSESGMGGVSPGQPGEKPAGETEGTPERRGSSGVSESPSVIGDGGLSSVSGRGDESERSVRDDDGATPAVDGSGESGDSGGVGDGGGDGGRGGSDTAVSDTLNEDPTPENPTDCAAGNWRYFDQSHIDGGVMTKFHNNLAALQTLRTISEEGRTAATPAEQEVLSKWVGWGQMPGLFNEFWTDARDAGIAYEDWYADKDKWDSERKKVKALMSDDEWEAAKKSVLNAHYTHPDVVDTHWKISERLGFKGGRFLEPSAGIGYYLGQMPADLARKTRTSAVELDKSTGDMLKMLYPSANVEVKGFEEHKAPKGFYDLVASNVPFGPYRVHDPEYNKHRANIHDYFFLKSADLTKPGGLVVHVTSTGTMDKPDDKIRQELSKTCDFVGAIRFPEGTHQKNAGTQVVTDMVILRKRHPGEDPVTMDFTPEEAMPSEQGFTGTTVDSLGRVYHWVNGKRVPGPDWLSVKEVPDPAGGEPIPVNAYFADHPEMVLGTIDRTGKLYHGSSMNVSKTDDYDQRLENAINQLPQNVLTSDIRPNANPEPEQRAAGEKVKNGGYVIHDGKLFRREGGAEIEQDVNKPTFARIEGQLAIRDARQAVIDAEMNGQPSDEARAELNRLYDAYVEKHGPLSNKENRAAMKSDPDAPNLLALEKYNPAKKTAEKADMFSKATIRPNKSTMHAENIEEGVGISLNETGGVDPSRIAELTGKSLQQVEKDLANSPIVFEDPAEGWVPADRYLSGNVRKKLVLAKAAAAADPKYKKNVEALEKNQPEDIDYQDIDVKLGAPWIPADDIRKFASEICQSREENFKVAYIPSLGEWQFHYEPSYRWDKHGTETMRQLGTNRKEFDEIMSAIMNSKSLTVYDTDEDGKRIYNEDDTRAVQEKAQELRDKFSEWIFADEERRDRLHRYYNDNFNNIKPMHYDGSHQTFPGMSEKYVPRGLQKNFVWEVVTTGKGLAAHEVGTGKAQPLDAKILTPFGWKLMGEIQVGDEVISVDGSSTVVTGVYPQGEREIFKVVFSDGASTECCEEHLWLTQTYHERNYAIAARKSGKTHWNCDKPKVRSLSEIRKTLIDPRLSGVKNHSIPIVKSVDFVSTPISIDPYTLGAILGDGSISSGTIVITTADDEIIKNIELALPDTLRISKRTTSKHKCASYGISMSKSDSRTEPVRHNSMTLCLKSLELHGLKSHEKFIPNCYKFNERYVRLEILQGLMDTDGSVDRNGCVYYYTTSNRLADDVEFIVRSLGGVSRRTVKNPKYRYKGEIKEGKKCNILCISLPNDIIPFKLQRKVARLKPKTKYLPTRYIVDVFPIGKKTSQCISVSHESHLYVTDDFIVTHNTLSLITSAMELRRLGLAKKPCLAVMKANIEQITKEALDLYPGAKILSTADNFDAANRKKMVAQIATGDYDLVIMTHDHMDLLGMKPDTVKKYIQEELDELEQAKEAAWKEDPKKTNRVVKSLEDAKAKLESKLKDAIDAEGKDDAISFEESGIDQLFVDEAHLYKSLPVYTRGERVKGIPQGRSDRATNMLMRTRWLMENNGGRGVVFATGTPVANTMAELYNIQRYLQPNELKERGIANFDAWASTFGEKVMQMEATATGEYQPVTRFSKFVNIPELMSIAGQVMDVQRADNLKDKEGKPVIVRPHRHDKIVTTPPNDWTKKMMEDLQERARRMKGQRVQKGADNMAVVCSDGRKGSVDMRLLYKDAPDLPDSKTNQCVRNILELHKKRPGVTQLVFSNVGVNPQEGTGFHLYADIIDKLVKGGIPREKIADFSKLEGAKKDAAQEAMRRGDIVVGIGSTQKLGTGVNVQNRVAAMHHLDVPWQPAEIEQRDGRGYRHGNRNNPDIKDDKDQHVDIYRYVSEGSLDTFFWQIVGNKAHFINQIINGNDKKSRTISDEDTETLTPEQLMAVASGDPRILKKIQLDADVRDLKMGMERHKRDQEKFVKREKQQKEAIERAKQKLAATRKDAEHLSKLKDDKFSIKIGGQTYSDRAEAGEAIERKIYDFENSGYTYRSRAKNLGEYKGFTVQFDDVAVLHGNGGGNGLSLVGPSGESYSARPSVASIESVLRGIDKRIEQNEETIKLAEKDLETIRASSGKDYRRKAEYEAKLKELKDLEKDLSGKKDPVTPYQEPAGTDGENPEVPKESEPETYSRIRRAVDVSMKVHSRRHEIANRMRAIVSADEILRSIEFQGIAE